VKVVLGPERGEAKVVKVVEINKEGRV